MQTETKHTSYPEHEKLKLLGGQNQTVGNFIEWLGEQGYSLCEYKEGQGYNGEYIPIHATTESLLAGFFEIDPKALEKEKQHMIDGIAKARGER